MNSTTNGKTIEGMHFSLNRVSSSQVFKCECSVQLVVCPLAVHPSQAVPEEHAFDRSHRCPLEAMGAVTRQYTAELLNFGAVRCNSESERLEISGPEVEQKCADEVGEQCVQSISSEWAECEPQCDSCAQTTLKFCVQHYHNKQNCLSPKKALPK